MTDPRQTPDDALLQHFRQHSLGEPPASLDAFILNMYRGGTVKETATQYGTYATLRLRLANVLGVGRGADLLLYALVIAFLSYISTSHRRMNRMSRQITLLTRELTLAEARAQDKPTTADR